MHRARFSNVWIRRLERYFLHQSRQLGYILVLGLSGHILTVVVLFIYIYICCTVIQRHVRSAILSKHTHSTQGYQYKKQNRAIFDSLMLYSPLGFTLLLLRDGLC